MSVEGRAAPALELRGVTYRHPETAADALAGVDLVVREGELVGVAGPTDAGKSTLCCVAMGLVPHFFGGVLQGAALAFGVDVREESVAERSRRVGLLFQNPFTQVSGARERVDEEVGFGPESHGLDAAAVRERVAEALALTGLEDVAGRHPLDLSGGQMQRMALAGLLAMRPRLLMLDEPTSQLDPAGRAALFDVVEELHRRGVAIVVAEPDPDVLAERCPRIVALAGGRVLADGAPGDVFNDAAVEAAVGLPAYARLARRAGLGAPLPTSLDAARDALSDGSVRGRRA
jgi:energy-coupling factor transporter ATP-binding protein EcfA2